jgi:arginine decarboxylase
MHQRTAAGDPTKRWTVAEAMETYSIDHWGKGYFGVGENGHLEVHPTKDPAQAIDLKSLVDALAVRDIHPPVLVRFTDVLRHRVGEIDAAFGRAIAENEYRGDYRCVYPIKVNQQRHVVEEICAFGGEHGFGLEAGSKPELLAALSLVHRPDVPIICNGFKDDEFIEMVILAQKIGKLVIPVVEKYSELKLVMRYAQAHDVKPTLGMRVKLSTRGTGKWETSGGARSKFGLFVSEIVAAMAELNAAGLGDSFQLLHFHLGSQVTNIRSIKEAVNELARLYVQLRHAGAGIRYLDVGGGLGVDYDGSQTNYDSSVNYTLAEYASDVVYRIGAVCDEAEVEHPTIVSESGRAMVAYHSALVFNVLGVSSFDFDVPQAALEGLAEDDDAPQPLTDLVESYRSLSRRTLLECFHDAIQAYDQALSLFNLGHLTLDQRSTAERIYWATMARVDKLVRSLDHIPEELENLPNVLSDTYFCNLSVFQSLPDSWAVDQLFPICPIHRLDTPPLRRGTLADITCDSDGKIDRFTDVKEDKNALELHEFNGEPYYIGAFMVGAYQEILGDMHNLFGDTHVVHVSLDEDAHVSIDQVIPGDMVNDVLGYMNFGVRDLAEQMRREAERAVKARKVSSAEAARFMRYYEAGLKGYTYLEDMSE